MGCEAAAGELGEIGMRRPLAAPGFDEGAASLAGSAPRGSALWRDRDRLAARVEVLEERLRQWAAEVSPDARLGRRFGLSPRQAAVLALILRRPIASRAAILLVVWGDRPEVGPKIVDVMICQLRRRLAPHGVGIVTRIGHGWEMSRADKDRVDGMIGEIEG